MDSNFIIGEISLGFKPEKCNWNCKNIGNWLLLKKTRLVCFCHFDRERNLLRIEFCKLNSQSDGATTKWAAAQSDNKKLCLNSTIFQVYSAEGEAGMTQRMHLRSVIYIF